MRVATFNAENLFSRPAVMNHEDNSLRQPVLDDYHRLNELLMLEVYSTEAKNEIEQIADRYKLTDHQAQHHEIVLREVRGKLWQQHQDGTRTWLATGSKDFLGWAELVREEINDVAIANTAKVLAEVAADIQVLVEIEDRVTLQRFHDNILVPQMEALGLKPFQHVLLMDGNDQRGIDVAILSRVPLKAMKTHIELKNRKGKPMFPRDCAMYCFMLPDDTEIVILANHFSSQASDIKGVRRKEQAETVARIVDAALQQCSNVIVAGDLNEAPGKGNLAALLTHPHLKDAMAMDQYGDDVPGTYRTGAASMKLDYLFLSQSLQEKVQKVGVERRGYYSKKWDRFDTVTNERTQASDHHCVWVDLKL